MSEVDEDKKSVQFCLTVATHSKNQGTQEKKFDLKYLEMPRMRKQSKDLWPERQCFFLQSERCQRYPFQRTTCETS